VAPLPGLLSEDHHSGIGPRMIAMHWLSMVRGALRLLRDISSEAQRRVEPSAPDSHDRHRGDEALQTLIEQLAWVYQAYLNETPGASTNSHGDAGGPFINFAASCIEVIKRHVDEGGHLKVSKNAIRARLRNTVVYVFPRLESSAVDRLEMAKSRHK
jgi:hypothetical protein